MPENLSQYVPELLITAGIALLAIEILVFGFATFVLFFLGLSLVLTGALTWAGILPATWTALLLANAIISFALAAVLWKPLLKLQNKSDHKPVKSDFDGHRFFIESDVDSKGSSSYVYSGITWRIKSEQPIAAGTEVEVVKAEVGVFWVKPISS